MDFCLYVCHRLSAPWCVANSGSAGGHTHTLTGDIEPWPERHQAQAIWSTKFLDPSSLAHVTLLDWAGALRDVFVLQLRNGAQEQRDAHTQHKAVQLLPPVSFSYQVLLPLGLFTLYPLFTLRPVLRGLRGISLAPSGRLLQRCSQSLCGPLSSSSRSAPRLLQHNRASPHPRHRRPPPDVDCSAPLLCVHPSLSKHTYL